RAGGGADEDADVARVLGEPEPLAGEFFIAGVPLGERDRRVLAALVAGGGVVADADARALLQPGVVHGEDGEAVADEPQGAVEWRVADRCGAQGACSSVGWGPPIRVRGRGWGGVRTGRLLWVGQPADGGRGWRGKAGRWVVGEEGGTSACGGAAAGGGAGYCAAGVAPGAAAGAAAGVGAAARVNVG